MPVGEIGAVMFSLLKATVEDTLLYFTCGVTPGIVTFPILVVALPFAELS